MTPPLYDLTMLLLFVHLLFNVVTAISFTSNATILTTHDTASTTTLLCVATFDSSGKYWTTYASGDHREFVTSQSSGWFIRMRKYGFE